MALHDGLRPAFLELAESVTEAIFLKDKEVNLGRVPEKFINDVVNIVSASSDPVEWANLEKAVTGGLPEVVQLIFGTVDELPGILPVFGQFGPYVLPSIADQVADKVDVSEDGMRVLRVNKINASRTLTTDVHSVFVPGFADRWKSMARHLAAAKAEEAEKLKVKQPTGGDYVMKKEDGQDLQIEDLRVKRQDEVVLPYEVKKMTRAELGVMLKEVDRVPVSTDTIFHGLSDGTKSLSRFHVEVDDMATRRHWGAAHVFHYLSRVIERSLWTLIDVKVKTDSDISSYVEGVRLVWSNLQTVCGGTVEAEKLLTQMLVLSQKPSESTMSYLSRVSEYRLQCQAANVAHCDDDSYYQVLSRRGMLSPTLATQSTMLVAPDWVTWVRGVAMLEQRLGAIVKKDIASAAKGAKDGQ